MLTFSRPAWPAVKPRRWQEDAVLAICRHYSVKNAEPGVVSAIMGSGKSLVIAEICACIRLGEREVVVVSTSTELLVESLHRDISKRCRMLRSVGTWYGRAKRLGEVIVTCLPSVPALAERLAARGLKVKLWIADEVHKSECPTILGSFDKLAPEASLGVTATPFRSDVDGRISLFKKCIYRYGVADALADGVVCPWKIVHSRRGDELDDACLKMVADIQGPGLANATDIQDAEDFSKLLRERGIAAKAVHSQMPRHDIRRALVDLETGRLQCLVHVNLLTEGANYPWLRWLLLRREVGSRNRFIQEAGRLLRSHPGKAEAVFLDPHDLFGTFRLTYEEALGEPPPKEEVTPEEFSAERAAREITDAADPAMALAWIESVVRTLVVAADACGMLPSRPDIPKAERFQPSNPLQRAALDAELRKTRGLVPEKWTACFEAILARPEGIRFGFVADLLAVLHGVASHGQWPPVDGQGRISAGMGADISRPYPALLGRRGQMHIDVGALV